MKFVDSPKVGLGVFCLALAGSLHGQSLDWGSWDVNGTGTYINGGHITITGVVNGSVAPAYGENHLPHVVSDSEFPFDNSPTAGQ